MFLEAFESVAIAASQERSLENILERVAEGVVSIDDIALSSLYVIGPGDMCSGCIQRPLCANQSRCLHLVATALHKEVSEVDRRLYFDSLGTFSRAPLNTNTKEWVPGTSYELSLELFSFQSEWKAIGEWFQRLGVKTCAISPMIFRGEALGAMIVYFRKRPDQRESQWVRIFADTAAVTIANYRAFEQLEQVNQRIAAENSFLREEIEAAVGGTSILATSSAMKTAIDLIEMVAPTDAPVLILGETGVGKELVAHAIHQNSPRRDHNLVKVNCSAIPRELFESEFFGHVKGAFSGALRDRIGRFELADGGTLFLDEVGDLPMEMQPKLLRLLQEGEFEAVGDNRTRRANVRVLAATNRNLQSAVAAGQFRADLYYRLNMFPVEVPPLRQRREDIPLLTRHFVKTACQRFNRPPLALSAGDLAQLQNYDWPGNVRELQNIIERGVISARDGAVSIDLPKQSVLNSQAMPNSVEEIKVVSSDETRRMQRDGIVAALERSGGKVYGPGGAAELLGVPPTTLAARIRKFGLR